LGVGGPRQAEKGANEIFVTMGVNGEFLHFGGFWFCSINKTRFGSYIIVIYYSCNS